MSGLHKNTLEFTKDAGLTRDGDCIIGIRADFDNERLKEISKRFSRIKIIISVGNETEEILAQANRDFDDDREIVIRKSGFCSSRTLGIHADKSARDLKRSIIDKLKEDDASGKVELIGI